MDALERNKILGAIFLALLLVVALGVIVDEALTPEMPEKNVYIAVEMDEEDDGPAMTVEAETVTDEAANDEDVAEDAAPAEETAPAKETTDTAETAKTTDPELTARLAAANAENGAKMVRKCRACHSLEKGGAVKIGPPLWEVVGADKAYMDGFAYSDALASANGTWTYAALDAFLTNPKKNLPGTKMLFPGFKKPQQRADVIIFLRSLSDNPEPLSQ